MDSTFNKNVTTSMLLKFTLPTIASMLVMSAFGAVDGVFVSRLINLEALAAVNLVSPFFMTVMAIGSMLAMGGSALVAKKKGEEKAQEARQNFTMIVITAFLVSAVISSMSNIFSEQLLNLLGVNAAMHDLTLEYLRPISLMAPFPILGILLSQFMIADGKPTLGAITTASGSILNTTLNWFFISQLDMGIAGAAIATGIGYSLPTIIGLVYFSFYRKKDGLYFVKPTWDLQALAQSSSNGVSEFITMVAGSITSTVINNRLMDIEGPLAVAAVGIAFAVQWILMSLFMGYAFGVAPIISHNFGAQNTERLKKTYSISLKVVAILSLFALAIGNFFASHFIQIYIDISYAHNLPIYGLAKDGFRIVTFGFIFMGFNVFASSMFTALNNGLVSGILSIARSLVFVLITVSLFSHFWGLDGVWMAIPFAEVLAIFVTVFFFKKMKTKYHYA